jgi:hypothetical protein
MPRTAEDVENYLLQLDRRFENDGGTYLVTGGAGSTPIAIHVAPPIVAVRVTIGPVPADAEHQRRFFRRLLEYNASDLMHISYGIEGETVVLSAALELENLDINELEATLSDVDLALARHVPTLHEAARFKSEAPKIEAPKAKS